MPDKKKSDVGFNRLVRSAWLRDALGLASAGVSNTEFEEKLLPQIARENAGKETIRKVLAHLRRVWLSPPEYCRGLREQALGMYHHCPDAHTAFLLNWGMCIAAYPFIGYVAQAIGRLFRLQGDAQPKLINQRVRERFGDRHFVHRSVRYNLSAFFDMGALQKGIRGVYIPGKVYRLRTEEEAAWLVEALLHSLDEPSLPIQAIADHAALFPFRFDALGIGQLKINPRLQVMRHGMDACLVSVGDYHPTGDQGCTQKGTGCGIL